MASTLGALLSRGVGSGGWAEEVVASMSHQDDVEWARVVEATTAIVILAVAATTAAAAMVEEVAGGLCHCFLACFGYRTTWQSMNGTCT